jgi:aspartyl-tRNA(Asn)/glutamyl-tRNA(Gln) amidotransferase subunit A
VGFIDQKPVGLQIIGRYFSEDRLLNIGHRYQQVSDWHQRIPPGFA